MIVKNKSYSMHISDKNGSLISFNNGLKEFILEGAEERALFTIRFRDQKGNAVDLSSNQTVKFLIESEKGKSCIIVNMIYKSVGNLPVDVSVKITCPDDESLSYWNLSIEHDTDYYIEWIDFPDIVVPNDLIATGGDSKVFWPAMEGSLIEDADLREDSWLKYSPVGYPSKGWEGYYPGPCPMQFMAYYGKNGGLYVGAHDQECNVKAIEFYKVEKGKGIRLENRLFPGGIYRGSYTMEYDMVIGIFEGDWYDAANIYRKWFDKSRIKKPPKLYENDRIPNWIKESPIVVTYPVRGVKDTGDMSPNEYFPYTNVLPYINRLQEEFDSKILVLLMHWEGTAPWAPPYVWPPFGGEEKFKEFVDGLHERGNLAGVYCSGIAWTNESVLVPEYNRKEQFEKQNLSEIMCASPEGEVPNSLICNGSIRWGHDMCPANQFVEDTVVQEVSKIVNSGCDYIQYFDQNLGGASYFCYSKNHGHPPAPGKWQKEAMIRIFKRIVDYNAKKGKDVVIGCESAAAEPYIPYLPFNDLRFNINYFYGKPVPAYSYIYHEYINNFMGNQNNSCKAISIEKSPDNLLLRTAYSFVCGDVMTVVLKDRGEIHWDWCTEWDVEPKVDQKTIKELIKNLNAWRKKVAKPFLCYGRMVKPYEIKGTYDKEIVLNSGKKHIYPSLLTSRWISPEGREAQIIANYTKEPQNFSIVIKGIKGRKVKLYQNPDNKDCDLIQVNNEEVNMQIGPLNALMVEVE